MKELLYLDTTSDKEKSMLRLAQVCKYIKPFIIVICNDPQTSSDFKNLIESNTDHDPDVSIVFVYNRDQFESELDSIGMHINSHVEEIADFCVLMYIGLDSLDNIPVLNHPDFFYLGENDVECNTLLFPPDDGGELDIGVDDSVFEEKMEIPTGLLDKPLYGTTMEDDL